MYEHHHRANGKPFGREAQRRIVTLVRELERHPSPEAQEAARRGRELLVRSNRKLAEWFARKHRGFGLDLEAAVQCAMVGLNAAIDHYDPDKHESFTSYAMYRMMAALRNDAELEVGPVRLKSRAFELRNQVRKIYEELAAHGREPSLQELVDRYRALYPEQPTTEERIAAVLPHILTAPLPLDSAITNSEYDNLPWCDGPYEAADLSRGARRVRSPVTGRTRFVPADTASEQEIRLLERERQEEIRRAVEEIEDPLERRLLEIYRLGSEGGEVDQLSLYDGVYRDKQGRAYSSDKDLVQVYARRGIEVERRPERKLYKDFQAGELTWEPHSDLARELFELSGGRPQTSGTIQYKLKLADGKLRAKLAHLRDEIRYRGVNELEYSEAARERARTELVNRGVVSWDEAEKLKTTRPAEDGTLRTKGKLRELAEQHGIVDERGRLRREPLR